MICPNCSIAFHVEWEEFEIGSSASEHARWECRVAICPQCNTPLAEFLKITQAHPEDGGFDILADRFPAYPEVPAWATVSEYVPSTLAADYREARKVLPHSPKASAALSRRVLQSILRDKGYWSRALSRQIDLVLKEPDPRKGLPTDLQKNVDAIRNFGNFSAHPVTDLTTLQVIDVEPEEAEWCLELVERLFDHYYIRPAMDERRFAELNEKLTQAGKPLAKS